MTVASSSPGQGVRDEVGIADRQRRWRDARLVIVRLAPASATVVLGLACVARLAGWSSALPLSAWMAGATALIVFGLRARLVQPSTDTTAARVDADARLGGELRSAHWFASSPSLDEWTQFHLERAADRARQVQWTQIYPAVPARRAWIATVALSLATVAVVLAMPRLPARPVAEKVDGPTLPAAALEELPPDLQQQLRDLMTLVQRGEISADAAMLELTESATFASLDPAKRQQLTRDFKRVALNRSADSAAQVLIPPGQAADDQQWARDNESTREASQQAQQDGAKESGAPGSEPKQPRGSTDDNAAGDKGAASDAKSSAARADRPNGGESAAMRITGSGPTSGDPGRGYGGQHGDAPARRVDADQIAASLVREVVDAHVNAASSGQRPDDERRRSTEQSRSALAYTSVAERSGYDRARANAPHVVPEARRALLERYFVRNEAPR